MATLSASADQETSTSANCAVSSGSSDNDSYSADSQCRRSKYSGENTGGEKENEQSKG